jgi:hypothetical protein
MVPKREPFPEYEPATRPDHNVVPASERTVDRDAPPRSTWNPRPPMKSATYSLVAGRAEYEDECVPKSEVATTRPSRPAPPSREMAKTWRLRLFVGRIGRVSPAELLEVDPRADWDVVRTRYRSLVREFSVMAYASTDAGLRRRVALLLQGLAHAYEALAAERGETVERPQRG